MNAPDPWDAFTQWKTSAESLAGPSQAPAPGVWFLKTDTGFRVLNTSTALHSFIVEVSARVRTSMEVHGPAVHGWYPRETGGGSISLVVGPDSVSDVVVTLDVAPRLDPRVTIGSGLHAGLRSTAGWTL